ncbi:hypothetical protein C7212DRAFT_294797 [Tuber magnatum]|uniref:Uncharacterized protein n=1 Tax=Tuber magnatum TaxID=42249 RepID=A0A317SQD3_9PEZI|nr:hypothetical protein C7212DRAFT_294797 [Tuber magnatum]
MNRPTRPDSLDLQRQPHQQQQQQQPSLTHKRSQSNGSIDNPLSSHGSSIISMGYPLASVTPESAYIAASAATGIVTSNHESFLQDEGIVGPGSPTILVTAPSLKLINQFLDFLLYEFLSSARSTSLKLLRPAVEEVLRSRLAGEAISGADQELTSYLGGGNGEDDEYFDEPQEATGTWDLEGTWKKTRLRCMVYSSLGDLEEEDEAVHSGADLEGSVGAQQYNAHSAMPGIVSPAVAIWLTAVLEFVGEQTLLVAGHAAINRFAQKLPIGEARETTDTNTIERPIVDELDTEKVALNPSLSRLWRQWRKRVRGRSSFSIPSLQRHERRASTSSRTSASSLTTGNILRGESSATKGTFEGDEVPVVGMDKELEMGDDAATLEANKEALLSPIVEAAPPADGDAEGPGSCKVEPMSVDKLMELEIADKLEKRRPQSLILLPWTTESPFVTRSPGIKRPSSLPDLTRGDFPDPVSEDERERRDPDNLEIAKIEVETGEATETDQTPSGEERQDWPAESGKELESTVETCEQSDDSIANEDSGFVIVQMVQAQQELPKDGTIETESLEATENVAVPEGDEDLSGRIGVAHTSDVLVAPPASLSPWRACYEEVEETPRREDEAEKAPASPVYRAAAVPLDVESMHPAGIVEAPRSTEDQPPPVPEKAARRLSTAPTEAVGGAVILDDEVLIVTSRRGSRTETSTHLAANLTGNGNSSHSQKGTLTNSKHSQYSQLSDRKIGQLTLVQPSSSSCISTSSERANGVRMWTPPTTPDKSRRSSSFSKAQRPIYSSGSGTSQSAKLANMDERERCFEELISRGDTIHCTITPDPIRRIEGSPRSQTQITEQVDFLCNPGPDGMERPRTVTPNKSGSRPSSARAKAIIPTGGDGITLTHIHRSTGSASIAASAFAGPLPPPRHPDTAIQPAKTPGVLGHVPITITPRADSFRSTPLSSPSGIAIPAVMKQQRSDSLSTTHSRLKNRLVARDASGSSSSASTSALADFFRNTMPSVDGGQTIRRRISRTVAPFRNTMDSAQFDAARDPERTETVDSIANGLGFTMNGAPEDSYQSPFSSSTALLRSNSERAHDYGSMPRRKQTRVMDSYTIDIEELDDDPDLDGLELVIPRRKEESLIDFLRNVAPPPQPPTPPEDPKDKMVQKKGSSVSLIGRLGRSSIRKNSVASNADRVIPMVPQLPALLDGPGKRVPLLSDTDHMSPRHSSNVPPSPLSVMRHDSYRPTSNLRENRMMGNGGVQVRTRYQARGARVERDDTNSLLDFLRYTPPPQSMQSDAPPSMHKEEGGSPRFKLSFGRKPKRNEVY